MTSLLTDYGKARLRKEEDKMDNQYKDRYENLERIFKVINTRDRYSFLESDKKGYRFTEINTSGMIIDEVKCKTKADIEKYLVHEYTAMISSIEKNKESKSGLIAGLEYAQPR